MDIHFKNANRYIRTAIEAALALVIANPDAVDNVRYLRDVSGRLKDVELDFVDCDDDCRSDTDPMWTTRIIPYVNDLVKVVNKGIKTKPAKISKDQKAVQMGEMQIRNALKRSNFISNAEAMARDGEWDMIRLYLEDMADHLEVGYWLVAGKVRDAEEKVRYRMDTSSYEMIPSTVWDYLNKE